MPVTSFVPAARLVWPPRPARRRARKPPPPPKSEPPAPARADALSPQARGLMQDRLEAAVADGRIALLDEDIPFGGFEFTLRELGELLALLFAEDYAEPRLRAAAPTATAPATAGRIAAYAARAARGEALYHPGDATAHRAHDRGLRVAPRLNGSGLRVLGWEGDEGDE